VTASRYCLSETVQITVPGASLMGGYLARPDIADPIGSVIVGMELFGVSAHVRDICDRLASLGYLALAPDLYHRSAPGIELAADEHGRTRGFELLQQLTRTQVLDDVRATIAFLHERNIPLAGMVGLSVGGHVAYLAAAHLDLPAIAVFYGGWIPTTDITISQPEPTITSTPDITGRVLMLVGSEDLIIPSEHRSQIADALTAAGIDHKLIEYPGVGRGFLCDRRHSFHPEAANNAWNHLVSLLAETSNRPPAAATQ
jgi:carboxymethylenebutenolidase